MILKYDKAVVEKFPTLYDYEQTKTIEKFVRYIIDSKYRKAVTLAPWLKEQVENPSQKVLDLCSKIPNYKDFDMQIYAIRNYIRAALKYVSDSDNWDMLEYWADSNEIVEKMEDDCEGGATLMYVLARLKGIPANRLLITCGNVVGGGHAYLIYKPIQYPLNWVIMDWCYWPNKLTIEKSNKIYITGNKIYEYDTNQNRLESNYKAIWFLFNESGSYTKLREKQ